MVKKQKYKIIYVEAERSSLSISTKIRESIKVLNIG